MSLYSSHQLPEKSAEGTIYLMNPSIQEFKTSYFDDDNQSVEVVIPALETKEFPAALGNVIRNHLVTFILNQEDFHYKTDVKLELERIKQEVTMYE